MAQRKHPVARMSIGGKAPRKQLASRPAFHYREEALRYAPATNRQTEIDESSANHVEASTEQQTDGKLLNTDERERSPKSEAKEAENRGQDTSLDSKPARQTEESKTGCVGGFPDSHGAHTKKEASSRRWPLRNTKMRRLRSSSSRPRALAQRAGKAAQSSQGSSEPGRVE